MGAIESDIYRSKRFRAFSRDFVLTSDPKLFLHVPRIRGREKGDGTRSLSTFSDFVRNGRDEDGGIVFVSAARGAMRLDVRR